MSQYLSREIFPAPLDWGTYIRQQISYPFREVQLGLAAPRGEPVATHTTRAWTVDLILSSEADIVAFETFALGVRGRFAGFWMPSPESVGVVTTAESNDSVIVGPSQLASTWTDDACTHLAFEPASGATQYGKILSVSDLLNGTERITLETLGGRTLASGMVVKRLLYCRAASDDEVAEFIAPTVQTRRIRMVELPTEYVAVETGERPVWLYELEQVIDGVSQYWRFTSLSEDVSSTLGSGGAKTFTSFPITHRNLRRSMVPDSGGVTIETWHDGSLMPLSQMVPFFHARPFILRIYRTTYEAPNSVTTEFVGFIESIKADGRRISAKASSLVESLGRKVPAVLIQPGCNWHLYSAPCGVTKSAYEATGTVTSVLGSLLTLSVADPPISGKAASADGNYYALGWARIGSGLTLQERAILSNTARYVKSSVGYIEIHLDRAFTGTVVGQTIKLQAGCDGAKATCKTKFSNFTRHGGFVVPQGNPAVRAMEAETANGNKK